MHKPHLSTITILGLALSLVGCKSGDNELMATVNGETITREEYISHLERKIQVLVQSQTGPAQVQVAQPLNFQALNDLVNQKLLLQMAKQENVYPAEADVSNEMKYQVGKRADFVSTLTGQGLTLTDINNELRVQLARHNLLSKGVKISAEQVDAYIKENPKEFENHATVDLSWVMLKDPTDKDKVDADLKSGQTFAIVARHYTTAAGGERYQSREYDKFPARLKTEVDKLAENGTSNWLQDGTNWVKFHVEKKTPASPITIKDWMKEEVKRLLAEQKGSAAIDLDKRLLNLRKQANINITKPGLKDRFDQLTKSMKEMDMKNSTSNGGKAPTN